MGERKNPFANLNDIPVTATRKPVDRAQIDALAEAEGFPSRNPVRTTTPLPIAPSAAPRRRPGRPRSTQRTHQLNIKTTPDALNTFYAEADKRGMGYGELFEAALAAWIEKNS